MTQMRGSGLDTDTLPIIYATIPKNGSVSHINKKTKMLFFVCLKDILIRSDF